MDKSTLIPFVLSFFIIISAGACTTAKISGRGAKPITLNQLEQKTNPVGTIDKQQLRVFDYTGAVDVSEILEGELNQSNAHALTNTTVKMGANVSTFFVNLITLGLANAYTVSVNGDLVELEMETSVITPPDSINSYDNHKVLNKEGTWNGSNSRK